MAIQARERVDVGIERLTVSAYTVPTDAPESDGTFAWDSTTVVVVAAEAGTKRGLGYTYAPVAASKLVGELLAPAAAGLDALDVRAAGLVLRAELRNAGVPGLGSMALAACDIALWDLKARLLDLPLARLLGAVHERVPVYGSGGFTSYPAGRIGEQLGSWVGEGIARVKIKVGREPERDPERLDEARRAIGDDVELYVDANGAFGRKQALAWAERYARDWGVTWFEEPVPSDDLAGLRLVREGAPAGLEIAAGEYGYVLADFRDLLAAGAVDCLQADVTRCGITGLLAASELAAAYGTDVSGHCAPAASVAALGAVERLRHLEWFHDHVRIEAMLFDGAPAVEDGAVRPDPSRPGLGLELRRADAERYAA